MTGKTGIPALLGLSLILYLVLPAAATSSTLPLPGGPIATTPDGHTLLVANPDSNTLTLIDTQTMKTTAEIPVGIEPRSVVVLPGGTYAFVANQGSDTLSQVDLDARAVTGEIPTGDKPVGLALSPSGTLLATAESGADQVRLVDPAGLNTLALVPVADRPYALAFTPDGRRLLVSHLLSGSVTVITLSPHTGYLPLVVNGLPGLPGRPDASSTLPAQLLLPMVEQIDTWPNVAPAPYVVVNAAGTRAYLPQTMANGQGLNTQFDTTVFPKVSVLDLTINAHLTSEHIPLPETDRPVGLPWAAALAPGNTELWVVNAASNDISVIDLSSPIQPTGKANIPVEDNPRGIVFSPDGSTAYVNNTLAGTVSVIDTAAYTVTGVITSTEIPLPPLLLEGKRLFHSSALQELSQARWIACATCHIEGEHDGRTWRLQFLGDTGIRSTQVITRNTTSLLGMVQTYPLRWSAEWDESADSEFAVRFEQFGTGLIPGPMHPTLGSPNQGRSLLLDSLSAFIDSLETPQTSRPLNPAEENGRILFFSPETGCGVCHPPPYYTDFLKHDVGTAGAAWEWFGPEIDTPSLRFLGDSAPYLHHGSFETLLDMLTIGNPADEHGVTSALTAQELADLAAFLLALPYEAYP